ncbi:biotin-dependent enzyme [Inmirania thermothiophila]|uniref:Biotin-dependent enzyme n=1 Tax=Inmirania thermothiophila TaxID=1750597 RepID=A0A3N1Y0M3_9GAMM|nr:biotin-dependent enzyme [Inmirania thermothiophila]
MVGAIVDVVVPGMPDCWESCGNCAADALEVAEILVAPGQRVEAWEPVVVLEAEKTAYDIPTPDPGVVREILVRPGERVTVGAPLLRLERD